MPALHAARGMRLSVIVPCHDVAEFLPTALRSAAGNAAPDTEWIFVDDGSTDGTAEQLAAFTPPTGRALVLTNPSNLGVAAARNRGAEAASGRYLTYLDPDDWLAPGYLQKLVEAIERLDVDFVRTDHVQVEGRNRTVKRAPETRRWTALPAQSGIDPRVHHTSMVDYPYSWSGIYSARLRDAGLLSVDERVHTAEDRVMSWRLHLKAERFAVVGLLGYFYRRAVSGSLTAIGDQRQIHFFEAYDLIERELRADPAYARFEAKFVRAYVATIVHHEQNRTRLHRHVHEEFRRRARTALAALPTAMLDDAVAGMAPERVRILAELR